MPQVEISIGGRSFEVACQDGEEQFLMTAAAMLDQEAASLSSQIGRMPESRMLLMAGLLLADRTAGLEDKLREAEGQLAQAKAALDAGAASSAPAEPTRIEVPTLPEGLLDRMEAMAAKAETIANDVEARAAG
ncbi:MAG: cell division protein ZapA [Pseudomonadota bacterium]